MDVNVARGRLEDGANTQLRELQLPTTVGVPAFSDLTGVYSMSEKYELNTWSGFQYAGFLAGRLWLLSALGGADADRFAEGAQQITDRLLPALTTGPVAHENAGFDILYALAWGYNSTKEARYRDAALKALDDFKSMFRPNLSVFLCNAKSNEVVIDTAGPLTCFMWGAAFDEECGTLIRTHLDRILEMGLLEENGAAIQGVQFDLERGEIARYHARQGYTESSRWTRAQAWAIHNYLNAFEAFGDNTYLDASRRAAEHFMERLPENLVNFYDYDDPNAPTIPWDTCSTVMAANAFVRYGRTAGIADSESWVQRGEALLEAIVNDHMTLSGTVLHGSWGNARFTRNLGRFPQEDIMGYGNYWIHEAIYRLGQEDWSVVTLRPAAGGA